MAKTIFALAQSLQKRPSEIVGGFGHPIKDLLFDIMLFNEFSTDEKGNVKRQKTVTVQELISAHEKGLDELEIAKMLGVKVARRNPTTH